MNKKHEAEFKTLPYFGINKLLPYLKPYRRIIVWMVSLGFAGGLVDIILPLFQEYAIDHFIANNRRGSQNLKRTGRM